MGPDHGGAGTVIAAAVAAAMTDEDGCAAIGAAIEEAARLPDTRSR